MCPQNGRIFSLFMDNNTTHVVIMAGGIGSRLWPASTPETPKQFIDVLGVGKTLIQLTVDRFRNVCPVRHFWVITSAVYADTVRAQLPDIPEENILAEPEARNTAPCIAYSCRKIASKYPDANIVVTPADAIVLDIAVFERIIGTALDFSARNEAVVTVGIVPTRPETGYGYVRSESAEPGKVAKVLAFKEKPDPATAEKYLASGSYFWNAGIFVWRASTIAGQFRKYSPGIAEIMDRLAPFLNTEKEAEALKALFPQCEKISVDYAVMEKSADIYVIAADFGWSDVGSWGAFYEKSPKTETGNVIRNCKTVLSGCENNIFAAKQEKLVVASGLKDYIVVDDDDILLICPLSEEQKIKQYVNEVKANFGDEYL